MNQIRDNDLQTLSILESLYSNWKPNDGQLKAGKFLEKAIAMDEIVTLFIRWGRKGGKTDSIILFIARYALLNPGSGCYYFCPMQNQAREILWETNRLQQVFPKKYVRVIKNNDMRIILKNGSFVKLDGSDKYEKHRGTEPHFLVYDEFKDFDRRFHEAIDPNRGVYNCPLVILGTPPVSINEDKNYEQYMELQKQCTKDKDKFFLQLSSYVNCHNIPKAKKGVSLDNMTMEQRIARGKAYLARKKQELIERGEEYRWKIEYMAENVSMGKNAVFPMLRKNMHTFAHDYVHADLLKDQRGLEWFCLADPATSTVFGVLFICLNPYSKEFFVLDEIYEKDREKTTTRQMLPRLIAKMKELAPKLDPEDDWIKVCDEEAAWFMAEAIDQADPRMNLTFNQTQKFYNKKEAGLALIKDCLLYKTMLLSDRCINAYWEMEQYVCIEGKYPKRHDHLIDDVRYFLADSGYDMVEAIRAKKEYKGSRKLRCASDLDNEIELDDDWTSMYNNFDD